MTRARRRIARAGRHSGRGVALVVLAVATIACGADIPPTPVDEAPWDEAVAGAVAVTEWRDDGEPAGAFGPDGADWGSPDEVVTAMAEALAQSDDIRTAARLVSQSGDAAVGWVRVEVSGDNGLAADLRFDMRRDGLDWFVAAMESRVHCAVALVDGTCP